ncbi:PH-like domain-containing protein [Pseudactinotalea suaedae]|jgi:hypothetical protein|uniref:PH-like domain-containing protein n=1 Tax=Pseudactinotalea suaedae TaxID=1524924 RepID=UPI0012E16441|nr:hypothetical protein [Pseudactinotalea suaedae]
MRFVWIGLAVIVIGLLVFSLLRRTALAPAPKEGPNLPPLPKVPAGGADHGLETTYVVTSIKGAHDQRVISRGLDKRGTAIAAVRTDGVLIDRRRASTLFIPTVKLDGVRTTSSLVIVQWTHGGYELETGLRMRNDAERDRLHDRVTALIENQGA